MSLIGHQLTLALINAGVQSLISAAGQPDGKTISSPFAVSDIIKLYYGSLLDAVSASGEHIEGEAIDRPLQIDENCLVPEFDHDFTDERVDGEELWRGGKIYERPYGAYRVALNVKNKFGTDNTWLGMDGDKLGEWPVSYHGTGVHNALSIAEEGFKLSKGKRFVYGKGIYSTPEVTVAKMYAEDFAHEGKHYRCIVQNRVNPKYIKEIPKSETGCGIYWVSHADQQVDETELIRPYGLCFFRDA